MTPLPTSHQTASKPPVYELVLAAAAHLSGFFAPFLAPLIIWLIARWWLRFTAQHAWHALINHLLTLLAIGVLGLLAFVVFLLGLGGTLSVPPAGGNTQLIYFILFLLLVAAAIFVWLWSYVGYVIGAIQALRGKPAHIFLTKRRKTA
jgi:uncharacterized Tic20 family protein